jgi:hypothetical protein
MALMVIKTKLTEKDFINVTLILLFNKLLIKIVYIAMAISLILGIASAFFPITLLGEFSFSRLIGPFFVLVFLPAVTYFSSKKNYSSNKRVSEPIEYKFEKDYLIIRGESFNSELTWDKIYKVTQTKKWVLIWQTRQSANAIHRSDIGDAEWNELKQILIEHRVKNNIN